MGGDLQEGEGTPRPVQALLPLFWAGLHKGWTVGWDGDRVTVSRRGVSQPGGGWEWGMDAPRRTVEVGGDSTVVNSGQAARGGARMD